MSGLRTWIDSLIASNAQVEGGFVLEALIWLTIILAVVGLAMLIRPALGTLFGGSPPMRRSSYYSDDLSRPLASRMGRTMLPRVAIHGGLILSVIAVVTVAQRDPDAFELPENPAGNITSFFEGVAPQMVVLRQHAFGNWGSEKSAKLIEAQGHKDREESAGGAPDHYVMTVKAKRRPLSEVSTADQMATARAIQEDEPLLALQLYSELRLQDPKNPAVWLETGRVLERLGDLDAARVSYESAFNLSMAAGDRDIKVASLTRLAALAAVDHATPAVDTDAATLLDALQEEATASADLGAHIEDLEAPLVTGTKDEPKVVLGVLGYTKKLEGLDDKDIPVVDVEDRPEE